MAPGREELIEGRPFVGASGRLLWKAFYEAGLSPDQARVINVINCWPALNEGKKISPEQWIACEQRFADEVAASDARVVLALGGDAMLRLTGIKGEITRWRGHLVRPEECAQAIKIGKVSLAPALPLQCELVVPSLHPAYIIRQGLRPVPFLWADVERVARALKGDLNEVPTNLTGEFVDGVRCIDLETDGIDDAAAITLIGVAGLSRNGVVARSWSWPPPQVVIDDLQAATCIVGHHVSFDVLHLRREGIVLRGPFNDTMWAGQKVQPDLDKNLDTMSSLYLDCPRFKSIPTTNPERPRLDALYTMALVAPQRAALVDLGQLHVHELEMSCLPILMDMAEAGVRVDPKVRAELGVGLRLKLEEARTEWERLAPGVNAGSPVQLKKLLYETLDLPKQYKDKSVTTEKLALIKLVRHADEGGRAILRTLMGVRKNSKLISTYLSGGLEVVHPSYFPVLKDAATYGTATGRLSAQDPNIQNVPKDLRRMFVPHDRRNVFVVGDWSQIEAWIAARLSGDEALLEAIAGDIHAVNAALFKCDRTRAKNFMFGTVYGAGPQKIHDTMLLRDFEVDYEDVKAMMRAFKAKYVGLMAWRVQLVAAVKKRGYAENRFGRRRWFFDAQSVAPEIWAFQPSSNAADILWRVMHQVDALARRVGGRPPTLFCHDEVVLESTPEHVEETKTELKRIMEQPWNEIAPGFIVPAKITSGPSWGEAK